MQKELANLQKRIEDEKKADANRANPSTLTDGRAAARVDSPNDGFLAMRDEPDSESGNRLAKIPHGAVVTLQNFEKEKTTIAGRSGRWCYVTYQNESGWVFDARLQYPAGRQRKTTLSKPANVTALAKKHRDRRP